MNQKLVIQVQPIIDHSVRKLCIKPYYNHPKGCPNFNKKEGCPPQAKYYDDIYDLTKSVYAVCNIFNFGKHIENMKQKHPEWSERQLKCVLYWQGSARKNLKNHIVDFLRENKNYKVETCPEAMGVNITETMKKVGIELEWPPVNIAYQIALGGIKKKRKLYFWKEG